MRPLLLPGLLIMILFVASCSSAGHHAGTAQMNRCPVCGMSVEEYPNFLCQIELKDGSTLSFDGPKDMFTYYQNPAKYQTGKQPEIISVKVSDYYSLARINGRDAYFVTGSNVIGPMGKELIAFEKEDDAQQFMIDHAGKRLVKFKDVNPELVRELNQ